MKRILLHFVQIILLASSYVLIDLYENHINFMRTIVFYSEEIRQSNLRLLLWLPAIISLIVAGFYLLKKRGVEGFVLMIMAVIICFWQFTNSSVSQGLYYPILGLLIIILVLQILLTVGKKKRRRG